MKIDFSCRYRATHGDLAAFDWGCSKDCPAQGHDCVGNPEFRQQAEEFWGRVLSAAEQARIATLQKTLARECYDRATGIAQLTEELNSLPEKKDTALIRGAIEMAIGWMMSSDAE